MKAAFLGNKTYTKFHIFTMQGLVTLTQEMQHFFLEVFTVHIGLPVCAYVHAHGYLRTESIFVRHVLLDF